MPVALLPATMFGLLIGSFLNVVVYRLPRRESLAFPGSRCTSCETAIKPQDNIPVLSWLVLRGRCRSCAAPIASRYPLVEALTAALFAAVVLVHHADTTMLALGLVLVAFLVPMALIDVEHRIIPNRLTAPAAIVGLALGTALDPSGEPERLLACLVAGAALGLPAMLAPGGMGVGDAKLVGVLGLYLGAAVAPAFAIAFATGTVVGLVIMARKGVSVGRKTRVPFGPFLVLGAIVALLAGDALIDLYLSTF